MSTTGFILGPVAYESFLSGETKASASRKEGLQIQVSRITGRAL